MSWWYGRMQQRSRQFAVVTGRAYRPKIVKLGGRVYAAWAFIGAYLRAEQGHADPAADLELAAAVLPAAVGARALDRLAQALLRRCRGSW